MSNTNISEECNGLLPLDNVAGMCLLLVLHVLTLTVLVIFVKVVYDKVDIKHPVFAIVYQDLVVVLVCESTMFLFLVVTLVEHKELFLMVISSAKTLSVQFHQLSWLAVTVLRLTANSIFKEYTSCK